MISGKTGSNPLIVCTIILIAAGCYYSNGGSNGSSCNAMQPDLPDSEMAEAFTADGGNGGEPGSVMVASGASAGGLDGFNCIRIPTKIPF